MTMRLITLLYVLVFSLFVAADNAGYMVTTTRVTTTDLLGSKIVEANVINKKVANGGVMKKATAVTTSASVATTVIKTTSTTTNAAGVISKMTTSFTSTLGAPTPDTTTAVSVVTPATTPTTITIKDISTTFTTTYTPYWTTATITNEAGSVGPNTYVVTASFSENIGSEINTSNLYTYTGTRPDPSSDFTIPPLTPVTTLSIQRFVTITEGTTKTYTTTRAPTVMWVTITTNDFAVVLQTTYIQRFTTQYSGSATYSVGSVGLGSIQGTVGVTKTTSVSSIGLGKAVVVNSSPKELSHFGFSYIISLFFAFIICFL